MITLKWTIDAACGQENLTLVVAGEKTELPK